MQKIDYNHLKFRRSYLIASYPIECSFVHKTEKISEDYTLYYHTDLVFTKVSNQTRCLILLGDLYDYQDHQAGNSTILNALIDYEFDSLVIRTFIFAGRFVLIYSGPEGIKLLHDAASLRKIYYNWGESPSLCASNPHLLAQVLGLKRTKNPCWSEFYQSDEFFQLFNGNIGSYTLYDEIHQVLPNHYYDLTNNKVCRYWPNKPFEKMEDKDIIHICAKMIKGFVTAAANRYPLMIPVTSGNDSRIILAATKEITNNIYYYINFSKDIENKPDIWVPKKLIESQNRVFNIVKINPQVEENFRQIYYENNPLPHDFFLPIIYNYYLNFQDKINLPGGFIPLIKSLYVSNTEVITGTELAHLYHVDRFPCAVDFYNEWIHSAKKICDDYHVNIFDLLYWEDRTCNWGTQVSQDKDIAQEEFIPFNSRQLMINMLSYTRDKRQKPRFELHRELVKELWPELLKMPFNPSFKSTVKNCLLSLGIFEPIQKLKKAFMG